MHELLFFVEAFLNVINYLSFISGLPYRLHFRIHPQTGLQIRVQLEHAGLRQFHPGHQSRRGLGRPEQDRVPVSGVPR